MYLILEATGFQDYSLVIACHFVFLAPLICYQICKNESYSKQNLILNKGQEQSNREKTDILDFLPDGAIIYKDPSSS